MEFGFIWKVQRCIIGKFKLTATRINLRPTWNIQFIPTTWALGNHFVPKNTSGRIRLLPNTEISLYFWNISISRMMYSLDSVTRAIDNRRRVYVRPASQPGSQRCDLERPTDTAAHFGLSSPSAIQACRLLPPIWLLPTNCWLPIVLSPLQVASPAPTERPFGPAWLGPSWLRHPHKDDWIEYKPWTFRWRRRNSGF